MVSMSTTHLPQAHDGFFKHALSNIQVARDLLQAHLDPAMAKRLQWETLQLTNKSYTDEKLRQLHSDMVYRCQIEGKQSYLYLLIEHQSTPEPLLPFRFLKYNVALLTEHLAQRKKHDKKLPLPVVVNYCLYSGKKTPYPYSLALHDCFADPVFAKERMFDRLPLIDLGQRSEEELNSHGTADLLQLLLKQSSQGTFLEWIKARGDAVRRLFMRNYDIGSIHYILSTERKHAPEKVLEALMKQVPEQRTKIMTAARQLELRGEQRGEQRGIQQGIQQGIRQGMQQGIQQGMQQGILHAAKNMLFKLHMDLKAVQEATGLSEEELQKLSRIGL